MDRSFSISLLMYSNYWTMTRKLTPLLVVAYEKRYMYKFDFEKMMLKNKNKISPRILINLREKLIQHALSNI